MPAKPSENPFKNSETPLNQDNQDIQDRLRENLELEPETGKESSEVNLGVEAESKSEVGLERIRPEATIETLTEEYRLGDGFIEENIAKKQIPKNLKILRDHLKNLEDGFSKKEIKKIVEKYPKILKYKSETVNNYFKDLEKI